MQGQRSQRLVPENTWWTLDLSLFTVGLPYRNDT